MKDARWVVYLIECRGQRLYCGSSNDFERRLAMHREGRGAKFTRAFPPERVVAVVPVAGRSEALKLEARIKGWTRDRKRAWAAGVAAGDPLSRHNQ